jgi:putative ubiquitin-RnfH superfamily antitoxin RatB of RatAB toxin-antitoxin module
VAGRAPRIAADATGAADTTDTTDATDAAASPAAGTPRGGAAGTIAVAVAWATPRTQDVVPLRLPVGATVGAAVTRAALAAAWGFAPDRVTFAIHGRRVRLDAVLREGDRIDLLRPLAVDPKDARRRRAETKPLARPAGRVKGGPRGPVSGGPPDER